MQCLDRIDYLHFCVRVCVSVANFFRHTTKTKLAGTQRQKVWSARRIKKTYLGEQIMLAQKEVEG